MQRFKGAARQQNSTVLHADRRTITSEPDVTAFATAASKTGRYAKKASSNVYYTSHRHKDEDKKQLLG